MAKDSLPKGLYDLLTTQSLQQKLEETSFEAHTDALSAEESHRRLADALADQLSRALAEFRPEKESSRVQEQRSRRG